MIPVFEPEITFKDKVAVYRAMSKKIFQEQVLKLKNLSKN